MKVSLIVAASENHVIGKDNELYPGMGVISGYGYISLFKGSHVLLGYVPSAKESTKGKKIVSLCGHTQVVKWGI